MGGGGFGEEWRDFRRADCAQPHGRGGKGGTFMAIVAAKVVPRFVAPYRLVFV